MSRDDVAVRPEDGDQPLVVALPHGGGAPGVGQVPHRYVSDDVHLQRGSETRLKSQLRSQRSAHVLTLPSCLLPTASGLLQSRLQPPELAGRVRHVLRGSVGAVVEDGVEAENPQTRLRQLGVEAACSPELNIKKKNRTLMLKNRARSRTGKGSLSGFVSFMSRVTLREGEQSFGLQPGLPQLGSGFVDGVG